MLLESFEALLGKQNYSLGEKLFQYIRDVEESQLFKCTRVEF